MHDSSRGSLHLIMLNTLPVASDCLLCLSVVSVSSDFMLPWDNTVIPPLPLCVCPPLRFSLHNGDFVYFSALPVSVLGVFIRGSEEREMRLQVWRQVKVNKLSSVGATWAIIQAVYCTHLPKAGSVSLSDQLISLFLVSKSSSCTQVDSSFLFYNFNGINQQFAQTSYFMLRKNL